MITSPLQLAAAVAQLWVLAASPSMEPLLARSYLYPHHPAAMSKHTHNLENQDE